MYYAVQLQLRLIFFFHFCVQSGIRRLINEGTFSAYFPLHEGRYDMPHSTGTTFDRRVIAHTVDTLFTKKRIFLNIYFYF